jgi:hypothetical protein
LTNCDSWAHPSACVEEILDKLIIEAVIAYPDDPVTSG